MDLESSMNQSADRLTIDRRDLERAFLSIFDQLTGARQKGTPGRNRETHCTSETKRQSCCCHGDRNEMPAFSVLLGNPPSHPCNTAQSPSCQTAGHKRKILQIHLPETCRDPCQILITSHKEQVTVKYLQQGQQFTFSTNDSDGTLPSTPASVSSDQYLPKRDDDRLFSNREKNRVFSNLCNDEMFSNASIVDDDSTFDSASKSPMSVTIDRVFSKVQLDQVFSNVENDRILTDGNEVLTNSEANRTLSNETNRTLSSETDRTSSNERNRRLSNAKNNHTFPSTETDHSHSSLSNVRHQLSTDKILTDSIGTLPNAEGPAMSRNAMSTTTRNTVSALGRKEKASPLTFMSERNISMSHDASLPRRLSTTSESDRAEKRNCKGASYDPTSCSGRNRHISFDLSSVNVDKMVDAADDNDASPEFPPVKKQKKQSLNTFIDSLLTKRKEEEDKKSLENVGESTITRNADKRRSFDTSRQTDVENADEKAVDEVVVVNPNKGIATLFSSAQPSNESTQQSFSSRTGDQTVVFQNAESDKMSTKKIRFKCQYCNAMFQQRNDCLIHISKEHMEERPHKCPLCSATFKKTRSLRYHVRHHNGERPYKCTYCEKAFKEKYHLTVHIRTHTNERPFACMQCGKAFKQTNELSSHIRTHSGERPHKCDICNKTFKRKRQLYSHNLIHLHEIAKDSTKNNDNVVVSFDTINNEIASVQQEKP